MKLNRLTFVTKHYVNRYFNTANKSSLITRESCQAFRNIVSKVLCKTMEDLNSSLPFETNEKLKQLTEDSFSAGNSLPGPLTLFAYKHLEKPERITNNSLVHIRTLAWGAQAGNYHFTLLDKNIYANDASLLRCLIYEVLKKIFVGHSSLNDIVDIFEKAFLNISVGINLDNITTKPKDYGVFTKTRYNSIVDHKSHITFELPVLLAMRAADKCDTYSVLCVHGICTEIGRLAYMQKDFHNCYGDIDLTGPQSDIRNGKCTWLALTALQRCSAAQRKVFIACYGSAEPAHIERVKRLYDQLQLTKEFKEQLKSLQAGIQARAQGLVNGNISPEPFMRLLEELLVEQVMSY